jgi:chromosomal replication initiator protein
MWIEPLEFIKSQEGVVTLSCPNFFSKKRVQDNYGTLIESEVNKISKKTIQFSIEISGGNNVSKSRRESNRQLPLPNFQTYLDRGCLLRRDFTFDQFVVGGNNDFAYSAALALASRKNAQQNSLFLLSKTGLGKSHLSQAIGHHILAENPSDRVFYITVEEFSNEMIQGFRNNAIGKFKKKYRENCDVLLLEDVHYLTGKERTQIELAYTLDTLYEAGSLLRYYFKYRSAELPDKSQNIAEKSPAQRV